MLDPSFFLPIPEREELAGELDGRLAGHRDAAERVEQVAAWAGDRRFQVAVQALENLVTVDEASTALSDVAGAVIGCLLRDVLDGMHEQNGPVPGGGCAVVAQGRLGAGEMTFGSDLDLVFVADFAAGDADRGSAARRRADLLSAGGRGAGVPAPQPIDVRPALRAG